MAAALLLACGAAVAPADTPRDTSTSTATTSPLPTTTATVPATTAATTTVPTTTAPAPTTTAPAPTTTAPPPTATAPPPPTTTQAATTTTRPRPRPRPATTPRPKPKPAPPRSVQAAVVTRHALGAGCPLAAAALLVPGEQPLLVGPAASGRLAYPAGGAVVRALSVELRAGACSRGRPHGDGAQLQSLSLFGGAVTAARATLAFGRKDTSGVTGLRIAGSTVPVRPGARIPLRGWGYVVVGAPVPVATHRRGFAEAALVVHLTRAHAGLPAGTLVLVPAAGSSQPARRRRAMHRPLTITPPLALRHYVFPVAGPCDYGDSYGGFRGDVSGNWHHGDDLFAPLGTPVVAVASGTINRVGWEQLGGWRLWVRDSAGDEFYYAHLSGYAPAVLHGDTVEAGEVIGFVGNTGDAFPTTAPHLHFEIHPRSLLHLGYDGAVDPTSYLAQWTRLDHVTAPRPVHPPLPGVPALRQEARYVWRELLAARHLIRHAPPPERPRVRLPSSAHRRADASGQIAVAASTAHRAGSSSWPAAAIVALVALGALAGLVPVISRRRAAARQP